MDDTCKSLIAARDRLLADAVAELRNVADLLHGHTGYASPQTARLCDLIEMAIPQKYRQDRELQSWEWGK